MQNLSPISFEIADAEDAIRRLALDDLTIAARIRERLLDKLNSSDKMTLTALTKAAGILEKTQRAGRLALGATTSEVGSQQQFSIKLSMQRAKERLIAGQPLRDLLEQASADA